MLNVTCITVVLWGISRLVRRSRSNLLDVTARLFFLCALLLPLNYVRIMLRIGSEDLYWLLGNQVLSVTLGLALVGLGSWLLVTRLRLLTRMAAFLLLIFSPYVLLTFAQSALHIATDDATQRDVVLPPSSPVTPATRRVVWLLFDEFDFRLAFQERPSFLRLPGFDRLRDESVFATDARGRYQNTENAIPSYTLGQMIESVKPLSESALQLIGPEPGDQRFSGVWGSEPTLFSDLRSSNWRAAVTGLYHPYCRVFHEELTYCRQFMIETYTNRNQQGLFAQMMAQLRGITPFANRMNGIQNYREILASALATVGDRSYDFVYVHVSVPHGPEIFDSATDNFSLLVSDNRGYFGNLVLADRFLEAVVEQIAASGLSETTTLLVTSDHEWRRSKGYDGQRIDRIPFIVKLAGFSQHYGYDGEFTPQLVTRRLISELLSGTIGEPQELLNWLDIHASQAR